MITKELQEYYESIFDLFNHKGWTSIQEDVEQFIISLNDVLSIKDEKDLYVRQGQLQVLQYLQGLETSAKVTYEQLQNEETLQDASI